jgi:biotin/methionine sulfoxide reductase
MAMRGDGEHFVSLDKGTSRLAQGPSAHTTLVEMKRAGGPLLEVGAFEAPTILTD